jgi:hypothetical protein
MTDTWHPIHDNHAIDVMAAVVNFAEPIPELLFKKILKASEDRAFAEGLRSRHSLQSTMMLTLSAGVPTLAGAGVQGRTFNALAEVTENQPVPAKVIEQLQVTQNQVTYRTWQYISWSWQLERIKLFFTPTISLVNDLVFFSSQRLEYLDRFRFGGEPSSALAEDILRRDSEWLSPQIFSRTDLWHSHTGAYVQDVGSAKRLKQVHADAIDDPIVGPGNTRWINLMTARENRYLDAEIEQSIEGVFSEFDQMHSDLIELMALVVTPAICDLLYLSGVKQ